MTSHCFFFFFFIYGLTPWWLCRLPLRTATSPNCTAPFPFGGLAHAAVSRAAVRRLSVLLFVLSFSFSSFIYISLNVTHASLAISDCGTALRLGARSYVLELSRTVFRLCKQAVLQITRAPGDAAALAALFGRQDSLPAAAMFALPPPLPSAASEPLVPPSAAPANRTPIDLNAAAPWPTTSGPLSDEELHRLEAEVSQLDSPTPVF
jgi:hypothetical protein